MTGEPPPVTVFTVELLLRAFTDADSAKVLRLWRDGKIRPALNRALLLRFLRALRELGLPDRLLRWWAVWLSSPDKVRYVATEPEGAADLTAHYLHVAQAAGRSRLSRESLAAEVAGQKDSPARSRGCRRRNS